MKKALLLALAGLFTAVFPALAFPPPPANVNFASERGVPFGLVLDGRPLTRGAARQVHVDRLVPGLHWADFTLPAAYGRIVRFRSRVWLEPGLETTFVVIARPGRPLGLQQVSAVALCGGRGGYGNGRYNSPMPYGQGGGYYLPNGGPSNNGPGNGSYNDGGYDNQGYGSNAVPAPNQDSNGYDNDPNGDYDKSPTPNGGSYPGSAVSSYRTLTPQDVDDLLRAVQQRPLETSKVNMAKDALAQSSITADDLRRLLMTLSFESSKVELTKFAYPHVADRQNFYRVYQAFKSEASKREMEQAIAAMPRN